MDKYTEFKYIGRGIFGPYYKATQVDTQEIIVFKEISLHADKNDPGVPVRAIREISLMKELDHQNVIKLLDVVEEKDCMNVIYEYIEVTLHWYMYMYPEKISNPQLIKKFLHQILSGLAHIHDHKIIHLNLNPSNVFFDESKDKIKIGDFETAKTNEFKRHGTPATELTSLWYGSPELIVGSDIYSTPSDIWSVGCIFAEMINQKPLFGEENDTEKLLINIFRILGLPNEETWRGVNNIIPDLNYFGSEPEEMQSLEELFPDPDALDLLSKMLRLNPKERITAADALNHPFFKDSEQNV